MAQLLPTLTSLLALALSLLNLWLQRKDRIPRLGIRARYEYRSASADIGDREADDSPARIHDESQEGLYLLLGDFARAHGPKPPGGSPVVRFALSNEGERPVYLEGIRLVFEPGRRRRSRKRLVLDPLEGTVLPYEVARESANILRRPGGGTGNIVLAPGEAVGYKFELTRLANMLRAEGHAGNLKLALEATDRLGNTYRRRFSIDTDLWSYPG